MSIQTNVLYGSRLYDAETYSTNQDPESLTATLSDATTIQDTGFQFVQDALSLIEAAIVTDGIKALADSLSMTETELIIAVKILVDSLSVEDATLVIRQIKGLSEFILVKDWVELNLHRAGIWQSTPAYNFRPSNLHLYGPGVYYAVDFYSCNPTVNWLLSTPSAATWQMTSSSTKEQSLYSRTLYAQELYSVELTPGWTPPVQPGRQSWTNENGESHN